ncbi:nucleic acid-binding protein [Rhizodiscina lignyota]|uniref:Nucleic acid-binding protein n=1 Tax=Rhizodiscina lignyota TaxID=1504668 RepID=A0A9P4M9J6_9PEZI|nr:nucleic acid-binding protein [Rhizodiscina lignyota]
MAALPSLDEKLTSLLVRTFPSADTSSSDAAKLSGAIFGGEGEGKVQYTDGEKAEINQWAITASHIGHWTGSSTEDGPKQTARLQTLNTHLSSRTTLLGSKPSIADVVIFSNTAPLISSWSSQERTGEQGYHHIVRHADFVQHSPLFGPLKLEDSEKVKIDVDEVVSPIKPVDAKAEKEKKKREKEELAKAGAASAAAAGATTTSAAPDAATDSQKSSKLDKIKDKAEQIGAAAASAVGVSDAAREAQAKKKADKEAKKADKKGKEPKQQPPKPADKPLSPSLIDLRVGHILKAVQHPNADSLYVSTIAVGDPAGTENTSEYEGQVVRTVCSGLSGRVPLEEMQGRKVVVVCNLKPVTMRGIKSCAMVLAASPRPAEGEDGHHSSVVELVTPPADSKAGERVYVDGWESDEPEGILNPKKKVWESIQPGYQTSDELEMEWDVGKTPLAGEGENKKSGVAKLRTKEGTCTVKNLKGASIS